MKLPWSRTKDADNLTDFLANCIDAWHKSHPDLKVSEIIGACDKISERLTEGVIHLQSVKP